MSLKILQLSRIIISYLLIFSILLTNTAFAMQGSDDEDIGSGKPKLSRQLKRSGTAFSGDEEGKEGTPPQQLGMMIEVVGFDDQGGGGEEDEVIHEVFTSSLLEEMPPEKLKAVIQRVEEDGGYYRITFRSPTLKPRVRELGEESALLEAPDPLQNHAPVFVLKTNALSDELKEKLGSLQRKVIEGKLDGVDAWGTLVGLIIGLGTCVAMVPVFNGGFGYLASHWHLNFLYIFISGNNTSNYTVLPYVLLSTLPDAVPRNIETWRKAFRACKEKTVEWGRLFKRLAMVLGPSLLEPTYLILTELHNMSVTHSHGLNNPFAPWMFLSLFLFSDAMASNYMMAGEAWDDFKGWFQISRSWLGHKLRECFEPCLGRAPPSPEATLRSQFRTILHTLNLAFLTMNEAKRNIIYETVFESDADLKEQLPDLNKDEFACAKGFFTMRYLLSLGKQVPQVLDEEEGETWGSLLRKGILAAGTPARLLVLEFVFETLLAKSLGLLLGLFLPSGWASGIVKFLGWVAALVSFPSQTGIEHVGMKHVPELWGPSEEGHNSHVWARRLMKGISCFQGVVFSLPLLVLCAQVAIASLGSPYWVIGSIPFVLAETATQITSFHDRYNKKDASAVTDLHNLKTRKCRRLSPRPDYRCDRLMRIVTEYMEKLEHFPPHMLHELARLLELEEKTGIIINEDDE